MTKTYSAIGGILLLSATAFLFLSLVGYCPADSTLGNYFPANETAQNPCGAWGAFIAEYLFYYFGWGAYVFLASLGVYVWLTFARQAIDNYFLRALGWWLGLIGLLICFTLLFNDSLYSSLPFGSGGLFGNKITQFLLNQFAFGGTIITGICLILISTIMCTENLFFLLLNVLAAPIKKIYQNWKTPDLNSNSGKPFMNLAPAGAGAIGASPVNSASEPVLSTVPNLRERPDVKPAESKPVVSDANKAATVKSAENPVQTPPAVPKAATPINTAPAPKIKTDKGDNKGWFWNRILPGSKEPKAEIELPESGDNPISAPHTAPAPGSNLLSPDSLEEDLIESLASEQPEKAPYELPPITLLEPPVPFNKEAYLAEIQENSLLLESTMADYGVNVKVVDHQTGPVLTMYEIKRERGTRLNKITALEEDLSVAMKSGRVRVVAPLPGRDTIGIEIPNQNKKSVRLREVIEESTAQTANMNIPVYLGCDVSGEPMFADLAKLPHLLIAGQTGSGKSVCLHSIIVSILMTRSPADVRLLMIDPKMVELSQYKSIPHLMHPVVTDMKKAEALLAWAVEKMEERYTLLAKVGARHVSQYNKMSQAEHIARIKPETEEEAQKIPEKMPFIVIIADEMADMMMNCPKEVESHITRLAQKSRAVGIHLILATQKPTKDVVTSLIKSNLPARISFKVTCLIDSRVVFDLSGAERLLGSGDMLFLKPGTSCLIRGQGAYLDDDEIERVIRFVGKEEEQEFEEDLVKFTEQTDDGAAAPDGEDVSAKDELYDAAVEIVVNEGRGSISLLQTRMSIGYGRAARLIEMMTKNHILSAHNGIKPRELLISPEDWEIMKRQKQAETERAVKRVCSVAPHASDAPNLYASQSSAIVEPVESRPTTSVNSAVPFDDDSQDFEESQDELDENSIETDSDEPYDYEAEESDESDESDDFDIEYDSDEESEDAPESGDDMFADGLYDDSQDEFIADSEFSYDAKETDLLDKISKASQEYLNKKK